MEKARAEAYLRSEQRKQRQQMARVEVTSGGVLQSGGGATTDSKRL